MNSRATRIVTIAALACTLVACDQQAAEPHETADPPLAPIFTPLMQQAKRAMELETRTFTLEEGVSPLEAANIIDAYVYRDRPNDPGMISADRNMLSVRETRDNLDRIGRVIDELNASATTPTPATTLHFQLVEADGASETDPRIADVEAQLRKVLRFDGYRLLGEAFVNTQAGPIDQPIRTPDGGSYRVEGSFGRGYEVSGPNIKVVDSSRELSLTFSIKESVLLRSTVNIRNGQTIVLGSARAPGQRRMNEDDPADRDLVYYPGPQVILILRAKESVPDDNA